MLKFTKHATVTEVEGILACRERYCKDSSMILFKFASSVPLEAIIRDDGKHNSTNSVV